MGWCEMEGGRETKKKEREIFECGVGLVGLWGRGLWIVGNPNWALVYEGVLEKKRV